MVNTAASFMSSCNPVISNPRLGLGPDLGPLKLRERKRLSEKIKGINMGTIRTYFPKSIGLSGFGGK